MNAQPIKNELARAWSQLRTSREEGSLHDYIDDQHIDLEWAINQALKLITELEGKRNVGQSKAS